MQEQEPTRLPHIDFYGRAQTHTRPALDQKLSQQRRGEQNDAMDEPSRGVNNFLPASSCYSYHFRCCEVLNHNLT